MSISRTPPGRNGCNAFITRAGAFPGRPQPGLCLFPAVWEGHQADKKAKSRCGSRRPRDYFQGILTIVNE